MKKTLIFSLVAGLATSMVYAQSSLNDARVLRGTERSSLSDFESFEAFVAGTKALQILPGYRWVSGANLFQLDARFRQDKSLLGGALTFKAGIHRLKVDGAAPPTSLTLISGGPAVDDWGFAVGLGWEAGVPLAEGLTWGWDLDIVRDAFNDTSYSPSVTLSYALPSQGDIKLGLDLTGAYEQYQLRNADDQDATSAAIGLRAAYGDYRLTYTYLAPSKAQDYGYAFRLSGGLPGYSGVRLVLGYERDDVKYVGVSYRF